MDICKAPLSSKCIFQSAQIWHTQFYLQTRHTCLYSPAAEHHPNRGPCLLWRNGWMDQDTTWYRGRPRPRRHCVRCGPSSPHRKGHSSPALFGPCLLWPNGRPSQQLLSCCIIALFTKVCLQNYIQAVNFKTI